MDNELNNLEKYLQLFVKYVKYRDKIKQEVVANKFIKLKNDIRENIHSYSVDDKSKFKYLCAEFKLVSNEKTRDKLFERYDHKNLEDSKAPNKNISMLNKAKDVSSTTTSKLRRSMENLEQCREMAEEAQIIIDIDNNKIQNINNHVDEMQTDTKTAGRLITRFIKRLYTDKIIFMFIFIIVCLVLIILLSKFKIIKY
jgi:hypothetical protein